MNTIGDTVSAVATAVTGFGWALYFAVGALTVGGSLVFERLAARAASRVQSRRAGARRD